MSTAITKILSLESLLKNLDEKNEVSSYLEIMKAAKILPSEFEPFYHWSDDKYTRNCIHRTDDYELLVICYEKGQITPIHDFDLQEAWVHPIKGKLLEERFRISTESGLLEKVSATQLGTEDFSYLDEITIHRYSNIYDSRTVSLNLYVKPVGKWRIYNEWSNESYEQDLKYDSAYGKTFR